MNYPLRLIWVFVSLALEVMCSDAKICDTEICKKMASEIILSMDSTVSPCDDFNRYICGNFRKVHEIAPGEASVNAFSLINKKINKELRTLLENQPLANELIPQTQASIFYRSCMDKLERDKVSETTIQQSLATINQTMSFDEALATFLVKGLTTRFIDISSTPDAKNPRYFITEISIPSVILSTNTLKSPERSDSKQQIQHYKRYMSDILDIMKLWITERTIIDDIVQLNIKLSSIIPSIVDQRNPDKAYNKINIKDLQKRCSEISWKFIINYSLRGTGRSFTDSTEIIVNSLSYIDGLCKLLKLYKSDTNLKRILYMDLIWAELSSIAKYGSDKLVKADENLQRKLFGIKGQKKLWQTCVKTTSNSLLDIMSNMYVKKNFDVSKKKDIEKILLNIRKVLREVLVNVTWMDGNTKQEALKKLSTVQQKIGYPEWILDEAILKKKSEGLNFLKYNFVANLYLFKRWDFKNVMKYANEKIPDDKWFIGPHQVNAYYAPWSNEVVFPAAILQYPFYDIGYPVSSKYGGIGMVIGHEIIHGFDTLGSKFDSNGLLREWWTTESRKKYISKAKCIQKQYGNYSIYGEQLQPKQTIGEDIADNAGLRMAYMASQSVTDEKYTLPGLKFTPEQLFFVQEAWMWCYSSTKQSALEYVKTNVHTIGKFRIIGPLSNMPEFSYAFRCNKGHKIMNPSDKCLVW